LLLHECCIGGNAALLEGGTSAYGSENKKTGHNREKNRGWALELLGGSEYSKINRLFLKCGGKERSCKAVKKGLKKNSEKKGQDGGF